MSKFTYLLDITRCYSGANFKIFALGENIPVIINPVQINYAFQVIELMLEDARNKALQSGCYEFALLIGVADPYFFIARHSSAYARYAQAAFPVFFFSIRQGLKSGINHHRRLHQRCRGVTQGRARGDNDNLFGYADLRRGDADALGCRQGVLQGCDQLPCFIAKAVGDDLGL